MPPRTLPHMLHTALDAARAKARTAARALGEKIVARASAIAMDKGLIDRPATLDDALRQLKALRAQGLSREDFDRLKKELRDRLGPR